MAVEILDRPIVYVDEDVTFKVLAVEGEQPDPVENRAAHIGCVATRPGDTRIIDGQTGEVQFTIPGTMVVGMIGEGIVYQRVVESEDWAGETRRFYGFRLALAKRRAARQVKSTLKA